MQLGNYYNTKTVKLDDSYVVYMHNLKQREFKNNNVKSVVTNKWDPFGDLGEQFNTIQNATYSDSRLIELHNCIDVKLPSYKYKVESHQYGNLSHKAILPDYSATPVVTIQLAETKDYLVETILKHVIRRNIKNAGTFESEYVDNGWLDLLVVDVLSNDLHLPVLRYAFGFCRLVDYTVPDYNYADDNLPVYELQFMFEKYKKIYKPTTELLNPEVLDTRNQVRQIIEQYNTLANKPQYSDQQTKEYVKSQLNSVTVKQPAYSQICRDPATIAPTHNQNIDYDILHTL